MKKRIIIITSIILAIAAALLIFTQTNNRKTIVLATGDESGNYYNFGLALANKVNEECKDFRLEVVSTQGTPANFTLIDSGIADLAIVQEDLAKEAIDGTGTFKDNPVSSIYGVSTLYGEYMQIVTLNDSEIESFADLADKKISVGQEGSGSYRWVQDYIEYNHLDISDFDICCLSYTESTEALKNGTIDAFICVTGIPSLEISNLCSDNDIRLISLDNDSVSKYINSEDTLNFVVIPAGTYAGQSEDISTVGTSAILIASDSADEKAVSEILSVLEENYENIESISLGNKVEDKATATPVMELDMYMTMALAVVAVYLGKYLRKKVKFFEKFCIPAPVIGGFLFSIITLVLYMIKIVEFDFDETLKNICMIIFFTTVGFQANVRELKRGGRALIVFLAACAVLTLLQNLTSIGVGTLIGIDKGVSICTGSIALVGGHGTSAAFGPVLEALGVGSATTLCTAAATFGLICGSLMGGPLANSLIKRFDLTKTAIKVEKSNSEEISRVNAVDKVGSYMPAAFQIAIAMGLGSIVSKLLSLTGMTFPSYIGGMIIAAIMRNISEISSKFETPMREITDIGSICLSLFLGIAMITLKLWQLIDLALPLLILLAAQTVLMYLFARFVLFNILGRDYDAAVICAGTCGFGMGATPNAMANMQSVTEKYLPSVKAYLLVPIVGGLFCDFINSAITTVFINLL